LALRLTLIAVFGLLAFTATIQAAAFPRSAKLLAQREVERVLRSHPTLRVMRLSMANKAALLIDEGLCSARLRHH
jgi:hypothetical protein